MNEPSDPQARIKDLEAKLAPIMPWLPIVRAINYVEFHRRGASTDRA